MNNNQPSNIFHNLSNNPPNTTSTTPNLFQQVPSHPLSKLPSPQPQSLQPPPLRSSRVELIFSAAHDLLPKMYLQPYLAITEPDGKRKCNF